MTSVSALPTGEDVGQCVLLTIYVPYGVSEGRQEQLPSNELNYLVFTERCIQRGVSKWEQ